jgi:hypothetical protein
MKTHLEECGAKSIITIVDPTLVYQLAESDQPKLRYLLKNDEFYQAPAGSRADLFILQLAADQDAAVISNDRFKEYPDLVAKVHVVRYLLVPSQTSSENFAVIFDLDDLGKIAKPVDLPAYVSGGVSAEKSSITEATREISTRRQEVCDELPYQRELHMAYRQELLLHGEVLASRLKPTLISIAPQFEIAPVNNGKFSDFLQLFVDKKLISLTLPCPGRIEVKWIGK